MKVLTYLQFEPSDNATEQQLVLDLETAKNYLRGKLPDEELRALTMLQGNPFSERNYQQAVLALEDGIAYLGQYDAVPLRPDQQVESAIVESCHVQREKVSAVLDQIQVLCGNVWRVESSLPPCDS